MDAGGISHFAKQIVSLSPRTPDQLDGLELDRLEFEVQFGMFLASHKVCSKISMSFNWRSRTINSVNN